MLCHFQTSRMTLKVSLSYLLPLRALEWSGRWKLSREVFSTALCIKYLPFEFEFENRFKKRSGEEVTSEQFWHGRRSERQKVEATKAKKRSSCLPVASPEAATSAWKRATACRGPGSGNPFRPVESYLCLHTSNNHARHPVATS